jgi:hypothetical protein
MRALGYTAWLYQTVGNVEKGKRRVTAEEVLGLGEALETSVGRLMSPDADDKPVNFPSGGVVSVVHVQLSVRGRNDGSVQWNGDEPVFPDPLSTTRQLAAAGIVSHVIVSRSTGERKVYEQASGEYVLENLPPGTEFHPLRGVYITPDGEEIRPINYREGDDSE